MVSLIYLLLFAMSFATLVTPPRLSLPLTVPESGAARVGRVLPGGFLWENNVRAGDVVLAIDGRRPTARDAGDWSGHWALVLVGGGDAVRLEAGMIRRGHDTWPLLLLSPWFALLGTLIFLRAPRVAVGRSAYALFACAGLALALAPANIDGRLLARALEPLLVSAFAACFLLFFMVFPTERGSARLRIALMLPALLVGALYALALAWTPLYPSASRLGPPTWLIYLLLGAAVMTYSFARTREREARRGLAVIGLTAPASILPFVGLYLAPTLLDRPAYLSAEQSVVALGLLPAGFAYAILRHRVVDVPLIQRWLVEGLMWLGLLVPYTVLVYAQYRLFEPFPEPVRSVAKAAVLVLVIGLSFSWLRVRLRAFLDQLIFKDSYDYRRSLQQLSNDLSVALDLDTLGSSLPPTLRELMNLEFVVLIVRTRSGTEVRGDAGDYNPDLLAELVPAARGIRDAPTSVALAYGYLKLLVVPLRSRGEAVGHLCLGPKASGEPFRAEDRDLLATLSGQIAGVVRNAQLVDDLRANVVALDTLNERMQSAQEEERAHLAAEIHDVPLQTAIHLQRQLTASHGKERGADDRGGVAGADRSTPDHVALSQMLIDQLRSACTAVRPSVLDDLGLPAALDALALELGDRSGVDIVLDLDTEMGEVALAGDAQLVLYRAAQEAINNSLRHAQPSVIRVTLRREHGRARLCVDDDGIGFVVPQSFDALVDEGHLGLAGLRRRVQRIGGQLALTSRGGQGTSVRVDLPVEGTGR